MDDCKKQEIKCPRFLKTIEVEKFMIKRELYMKRIRPFIRSELIKVMTGIRRCGKSVMLELIKQEIVELGVDPTQFISINFEDMSYSHLQTA